MGSYLKKQRRSAEHQRATRVNVGIYPPALSRDNYFDAKKRTLKANLMKIIKQKCLFRLLRQHEQHAQQTTIACPICFVHGLIFQMLLSRNLAYKLPNDKPVVQDILAPAHFLLRTRTFLLRTSYFFCPAF